MPKTYLQENTKSIKRKNLNSEDRVVIWSKVVKFFGFYLLIKGTGAYFLMRNLLFSESTLIREMVI